MAIDLFIGSWTRYLTGDWETPAQRFAREANINITRVGPPPRWVTADEASRRADALRESIGQKLGAIAPFPSEDHGKYFALQLTAQSLQALVLCAAHASRPDLALPRRLPTDVQAAPAVAEAATHSYYIGPMAVFESHVFVVGDEGRICGAIGPFDDEIVVSTTAALRSSIESVGRFLDVPGHDLKSALSEGPPIVGPVGRIEEGNYVDEGAIYPIDEVRTHAIWGLACFSEARRLADEFSFSVVRDE